MGSAVRTQRRRVPEEDVVVSTRLQGIVISLAGILPMLAIMISYGRRWFG